MNLSSPHYYLHIIRFIFDPAETLLPALILVSTTIFFSRPGTSIFVISPTKRDCSFMIFSASFNAYSCLFLPHLTHRLLHFHLCLPWSERPSIRWWQSGRWLPEVVCHCRRLRLYLQELCSYLSPYPRQLRNIYTANIYFILPVSHLSYICL